MENVKVKEEKEVAGREGTPEEMASIAKDLGLERQQMFNEIKKLLSAGTIKKTSAEELISRILPTDGEAEIYNGKKVPFRNQKVSNAHGHIESDRMIRFDYCPVRTFEKKNPFTGKTKDIEITEDKHYARAVPVKDYPYSLPYGALLALKRFNGAVDDVYVLDPRIKGSDPVIFSRIGNEFYEIYWWIEK